MFVLPPASSCEFADIVDPARLTPPHAIGDVLAETLSRYQLQAEDAEEVRELAVA